MTHKRSTVPINNTDLADILPGLSCPASAGCLVAFASVRSDPSGVRVAVSIGNCKVIEGNGIKVSVGPRVLVIFGVGVAVRGVIVVVPVLTADGVAVCRGVPETVPVVTGVPVVAVPRVTVAVCVPAGGCVLVVVIVGVGDPVATWALMDNQNRLVAL